MRGLPLGVVEVGWDCNDGVPDFPVCPVLGKLLDLLENLRGDLLRVETMLLAVEGKLDLRLVISAIDNSKGPMLSVIKNCGIVISLPNHSFGVVNCVRATHRCLILC